MIVKVFCDFTLNSWTHTDSVFTLLARFLQPRQLRHAKGCIATPSMTEGPIFGRT